MKKCIFQIQKPLNLTAEQLIDIQKLTTRCSRHDQITANVDIDQSFKKANDHNSFLLYENGILLSFINLFAPKKSEAELMAFTNPAYRKKGFFSILLAEAKTEILKRGINDFLFVSERNSFDGQAVCRHLGAEYEFSEYLMRGDKNKIFTHSIPKLIIRKSNFSDAGRLIEILIESNNESKQEAADYIESILSSANRIQHVAEIDGEIAGMISVAFEQQKSYIHGLSVIPEFRKRGIGRALLGFKTEESVKLHPENEIELEVMTENSGALSIYEKAGFATAACYDYFRLPAVKILSQKNNIY